MEEGELSRSSSDSLAFELHNGQIMAATAAFHNASTLLPLFGDRPFYYYHPTSLSFTWMPLSSLPHAYSRILYGNGWDLGANKFLWDKSRYASGMPCYINAHIPWLN